MSTNEFCFVSFFFFVCLFVCLVFFAIALKVPFKVLNGLLKNKTKHPLKKEFFSSMESVKICQVSANEIKGERRILNFMESACERNKS